MSHYAFRIGLRAPSGNEIRSGRYSHHHAYARLRDDFGWALRSARLKHRIPKAMGPRRIVLVRERGRRERDYDYDNLVFGFKPLLDAMRLEELVVGDDPQSVQVEYRQVRARGDLATIHVSIEEVPWTKPSDAS